MIDEPGSANTALRSSRPLIDLTISDEMAWAVVDASPDALVMVNDDGVIELVNQQAEVLFGYDRVELLGRPVEMLLPHSEAAQHGAHRTRYRVAPAVRAMGQDLELWARRADGSEVPVEISLSPIGLGGRNLVLAAVRDISARKADAAQMRRLQRTIDSVADHVSMIDPETMRFVYVNRGATAMTGFSTEELLTMTPLHFAPDVIKAELDEAFGQLRDGTAEQLRIETTLRPGSGVDLPVEAIIEYPEADRGEHRVFVLVARDISERRAAEERTHLIQHSIDSVNDAVFMCDSATLEFTYVNRGAVNLHGYSRAELLAGMTALDLAPELPADELRAALKLLAGAPDRSVRVRTTGLRKDGTSVPVDVEINWPEPARDGSPRPVIAVVRDVTEQVRIEAAHRAAEAQFLAAFVQGPVPMIIAEIRQPDIGKIVDVNQALADLFGYEREELIGRSVTGLLHPDAAPPDLHEVAAIAAGDAVDDERLIRGIRKDGREIWLNLHVAPLSPADDQHNVIVHLVDVTARVEVDVASQRQQQLTAFLSEILLMMLKGGSREQGLALLCAKAAHLLDAAGAVILTPTGQGDAVKVEASAGIPPGVLAEMRFSTSLGGVGEVFTTGKASHLVEPRHPFMPEANRRVMQAQRTGPVLMAPLQGGDATVGVLAIVRRAGDDPFDDANLDAAEQLAASGVMAIELAQARANESTLQMLEDRERIGRDMHDIVIGRLFATGMTIQAGLGRITDPELLQRLVSSVDNIDDAIKDIRNTIYGVRSRNEWAKGIPGAILALAADHNAPLGFEPNVRLHGALDDLPEPVVEDVLAVIRESLTNTAKYARATSVDLSVTRTPSTLIVEIKDNGVGFAVHDQVAKGRFSGNGLVNMTDRADRLGGEATIASKPGEGTTVTWAVPL